MTRQIKQFLRGVGSVIDVAPAPRRHECHGRPPVMMAQNALGSGFADLQTFTILGEVVWCSGMPV